MFNKVIYAPANIDLTGFSLKSNSKSIAEGVHKGRTYSVYTKAVQKNLAWKVWAGFTACLLTPVACASSFYAKKSSKLWRQARTGHEILKVKILNPLKKDPSLIPLQAPAGPFNFDSMLYDRAASSGKGPVGQAEKSALLWKHHCDVHNELDAEQGFLRDVEMLTSRFADREPDVGTVVSLMDGNYFVARQFAKNGAFVSVLKGMEGQTAKIICRGTATRKTATEGYASGLNDVSVQIGQLGVQSIREDLKNYLQENNIQNVEVLGKSLGGGHAQALAVLLEGHGITVDHLITYASVGVGKEVNDVFLNQILQNRPHPFRMTVVRNAGSHAMSEVDYIPMVGGVHLGAEASPEKIQAKVYYLALKDQNIEECVPGLPLHRLALKFIGSFKKAHLRQNTLTDFHWKKIEDNHELQVHLKVGEELEGYRSVFARLLNFFLPKSLQHQSFSSFFAKQSSSIKEKNE